MSRLNKTLFRLDLGNGLYNKHYTHYRLVTDYSEFHLICYSNELYNTAAWTWESHFHQSPRKTIASALKSQPVNVSESHFVNRLMLTATTFNGWNLSMRVFPVVFEDAGYYTCTLERSVFTSIRLITVKVTAELSDTVTEGDTVTLRCSVSDTTTSMRLVWINRDSETVGEKTLNGEEKSLSLVIQKAVRSRGNWMCGVFDQESLQLSLPYNLEVTVKSLPDRWFTTNAGYLFVKLVVGLGLIYSLMKKNRQIMPQGCNRRGRARGQRRRGMSHQSYKVTEFR
ncbi:uncharacterized protein LOC132405178 [Hypanus sabinus]|uniref:uncharacterized protein LOC132405178 n=1 Tax=Hypanus sabinus TaxID=79690 RepID=UPI0028C46923|nr:uncharacterized protein LOC132405178 [Hypanus sabinus]